MSGHAKIYFLMLKGAPYVALLMSETEAKKVHKALEMFMPGLQLYSLQAYSSSEVLEAHIESSNACIH